MEQRRILFKAKRLCDNVWVEGDLLHKGNKTYIHCPHINDRGFWVENEEVDPSTVCKSTGLAAKDGTLIYEGDILSNTPFLEGEVSSYKGCFIVLRHDDSYVPLYEYINSEEPDVVRLEHKGSKFDRKEGEK